MADNTLEKSILLLGAITALGSLAMHMLIPALPAAAADLRVGRATVQLLISTYLLGLGIFQFFWGPIADRIGRRPVLLVSIAAFSLGSVVCALATTFPVLLTGRVFQALGGAGTLIACRAIVADRSEPGRSAGKLATLSAITLMSPALAPTLGGVLVSLGSWRLIFWALAAVGVALLVGTYTGIRESLERHSDRGAQRLWSGYLLLIRNRRFLYFACGSAMVSSAFYLFLSISPFILIDQNHMTPAAAGLCYFLVALALVLGTVCVRVIERRAPHLLMRVGRTALAVGATGLLAVALTSARPAPLIAAMTIIALGMGVTGPVSLSYALGSEKGMVGSASSLFGSIQMLTSAVLATAAARWLDSQTELLGLVVFAVAAIVFFLRGERLAVSGQR